MRPYLILLALAACTSVDSGEGASPGGKGDSLGEVSALFVTFAESADLVKWSQTERSLALEARASSELAASLGPDSVAVADADLLEQTGLFDRLHEGAHDLAVRTGAWGVLWGEVLDEGDSVQVRTHLTLAAPLERRVEVVTASGRGRLPLAQRRVRFSFPPDAFEPSVSFAAGAYLAGLGDVEAAEEALVAGAAGMDDNVIGATAHHLIALGRLTSGDFEGAVGAAIGVTELTPFDPAGYNLLAVSRVALDESLGAAAFAALEKSLELDSSSADTRALVVALAQLADEAAQAELDRLRSMYGL